MAKKFEAHMMYSPDGKSAMAATMEDHLRYKEMGWGYEKTSPLNQTTKPQPPTRGWAKLAYGASGSGGTQGGGFGNEGYTVDFTNIDFGKKALQDQMKQNEKKTFKDDDDKEEVNNKEVNNKEVNNKEVNNKEVNNKEVNNKEVNNKEKKKIGKDSCKEGYEEWVVDENNPNGGYCQPIDDNTSYVPPTDEQPPIVDPNLTPTDQTTIDQTTTNQTTTNQNANNQNTSTQNTVDYSAGGYGDNQYDLFNNPDIPTGDIITGMNSYSQEENRIPGGSWSGGTITKIDNGIQENGVFQKKVGNTTLPLNSSSTWTEGDGGLIQNTQYSETKAKMDDGYGNARHKGAINKKGELSNKYKKLNEKELEKKEAGKSYKIYAVVEDKSGKKHLVLQKTDIETKQQSEWKADKKVDKEKYDKFKKVIDKKPDGTTKNGRPYYLVDGKKVVEGTTTYSTLIADAKRYNRKKLSRSNYSPSFSGDGPLEFSSPMKHPAEDPATFVDGTKVKHEHDEEGKVIWRGKNDKVIPKEILNELEGGGINEKPFKYKSPFARRNISHRKVRDNYFPQSTMASPAQYSPFHQEQQQQDMQGSTIWDKVKSYGSDMDNKITKFIQHSNYSPETDKPINSFQNQEWVGAVTEWLQTRKKLMVDATNNKDKISQQKISTSVNQLIQDVTTYSGKFLDWMDRNAGDAAEGNAGGSVVSKGSKKDEKFIGDITFMGDKNTTVAIGEDGKLGIKSFGLEEIKYVEDLDDDVFAKDDAGHGMFLEASSQLQKEAETGKPLNTGVVQGHADNLLKNEDSTLSWAFDPLYGQAWIQDFAQGNPNVDLDVFMPESDSFDLDYLSDEVHGWLSKKLTDAYEKNKPQQPEQKGDAAQGIMDGTLAKVDEEKKNKEGVYAEGGEEPQGPPQPQPPTEEVATQAPPTSPLGYKGNMSKASLAILKKYNRI